MSNRQLYLAGYVAGYLCQRGSEYLNEGKPKRRAVPGFSRGVDVRDPVIYPTREKALAAAQALPLSTSWRRFLRPWSYETPNPANAKGMPLLSTIPDTAPHFLDPAS